MNKNFFYYLLPSVIIGAAGVFIVVPVTTYYLDAKDFGIFALLSAFTMPIGPLASVGVSWVLAAHYYKTDEEGRKVLLFNTLFCEILLKILWVAAFWVAAGYFMPLLIKDFSSDYIFYFRLLLVSIFLETFWSSISYVLSLQGRAKLHAFFEMSPWIIGSIFTVVCVAVLKLSTISLFIGDIAAAVVYFIACGFYALKYVKPRLEKKWLKEVAKVGFPSIPWNLFEMLTNVLDRYFIQLWRTLGDVGLYVHSLTYKGIFSMGNKAFSRTFSPMALEIFSRELPYEGLLKSLKKWFGLLGIGGLFFSLFSYEIVNILTHGKFVGAAYLIPIWFLLLLSFSYSLVYTQYLLVHKKNAFLSISGIIITAIFIGITGLAVYYHGMMGATISIVSSNVVITLVRSIYAQKLGCKPIGERDALTVFAIILGAYFLNLFVPLGLFIKMAIYVAASVWVLNRYQLTPYLKMAVSSLRK